ncbi:mitochondrial ACP precursor, putative [Plasmodium vivax]|uniref:Carrier domain-containing protein n=5 Tax=Plasmodium vivax TaxID=5855 RepID=A5K0I3_PLAVS|nr:hypothetical protein, conserved [Plasmodium vivax]KMZ78429.1 hypothetical protein PVIIG_01207 [Plasmodium vivax India VII]KMZ83616.1 hypothetical protein PVBG_00696 [Plasmodium vivax Brazil I]KMZ97601.1 hypothetical protein PVNG_01338 [Plasmodium vivax North Korean]EDL46830.1 hypothetical protein, conserved [Plasmodium vivax]CAG9475463.1 unnamed protein product [Plasmodium vivax]|eukprot:XP_001616557.1 hypothetical protein [Plasmodium vivax Sal-1]
MRRNILRNFFLSKKNVKILDVHKREFLSKPLLNNGMTHRCSVLLRGSNNWLARSQGKKAACFFSTEKDQLSSFSKEQIEEKVLAVLKKYIPPDVEINYNEELEKCKTKDNRAWDFLDTVEFLIDIESEFNITIPDETADNIKTVQEVIDYLVQLNIKKT